tara:strand:- start:97 stop:684 length:588 start_codon:yes stop_codon:yes gene_type:complete
LITFGCSYTYGVGLPDDSITPSKSGWASLLSQELGLKLINKSEPGASNTEILYEILTFNFKKDDTVIIMWTHPIRDIMFTKWTKFKLLRTRLGFWSKKNDKTNKDWERQVDPIDFIIKSWICIHHAGIFLKLKNLKYLHYPFNIVELDKYPIKELEISNLCRDGMIITDYGTDNQHPGLESNILTAKNISKALND